MITDVAEYSEVWRDEFFGPALRVVEGNYFSIRRPDEVSPGDPTAELAALCADKAGA
ncbi:hypothetical protein [Mycolicibacterium gilvum]|uniref:hypothetical protein n=1 Tax=Mycolicibacterium gilvum TaxID=1804 RepID=UPI0002F308D4|nr:hypothetical protein [Mycolicibacterium gilvum]